MVDYARVEIDVGEKSVFFGEAFRCGFFDVLSDIKELKVAKLLAEFAYAVFEDACAWVVSSVDSVTEAWYAYFIVEGSIDGCFGVVRGADLEEEVECVLVGASMEGSF